MKAEDQYFISQELVWITRNGNGIVEDRHLKTEEDHKYYQVVGRETRYVIRGVNGIKHKPALIYETPLKYECFFLSGYTRPTRKYLRELDNTYFKYYDDAEEVMVNIQRFVKCLKTLPNIDNKTRKKIGIIAAHLIVDVHDTVEAARIRVYQTGLKVKRRSELSPLARDCASELDLCPEKD